MFTVDDVIEVCKEVYESKKRGDTKSTINGVTFDDNFYDSSQGGRCQENVRKVYKAVAGQDEPGAGSSALNTYHNLVGNGFNPIPFKDIRVGDFLYFKGGDFGHTGIYMGNGMMWQQTSYQGLGICIIPIRDSQKENFLGAFRFFKEGVTTKVIDVDTGNLITQFSGKWKLAGDHLSDQNKIYLKGTVK